MKKTVSVNIKGMNFLIEEDAYNLLFQYITSLENSFSGEDGAAEIIEDIELRIAELCQASLNDKKDVIELEDIQKIIQTLGKPEEMNDAHDEASYQEEHGDSEKRKKLFRDIEFAKIGGVCAGISNYFNIDLIVVRAVFLLFLFFGGFGIPLYIVLWIIMPETSSTIDRLKMKGKPINVNTLKDELNTATNRFSNSSKSFANKIKRDQQLTKRFSTVGNLIKKFVGLSLLCFGAFALFIFLVMLIGGLFFVPIQGEETNLSINHIAQLILVDGTDIAWAWLGVFFTSLSCILFFISNGMFLLLNYKAKWTKISSLSLIGIGVIGFVLCFYVGTKTAREFANDGEVQKEIYALDLATLDLKSEYLNEQDFQGDFKPVRSSNDNFNETILVKNHIIYQNGVKFIYRQSKDSLFHIYQNFSSNAFSYKEAVLKAKAIKHEVQVQNNVLMVSPQYNFPEKDKIRAQMVTLIIEIPAKKSVRFEDKIIEFDANNLSLEKQGYLNFKGRYDNWD